MFTNFKLLSSLWNMLQTKLITNIITLPSVNPLSLETPLVLLNEKGLICVSPWLKDPCCRSGVVQRGWNYSWRPFKWAQNEGSRWISHLCRVGWKFSNKKETFAEKWFESCAYSFESKIHLSNYRWNIPVAWAQGHSPICHKSIVHYSGRLGVQKMRTNNMDPFAEQYSEYHCSILQMGVPANKNKADVTWVSNGLYTLNVKQVGLLYVPTCSGGWSSCFDNVVPFPVLALYRHFAL